MSLLETKSDELKKVLGEIEMDVLTNYTLADAIREGCMVTDKAQAWQQGDSVCALSAAVIAARARGYI